jgi:hypothetical protein
MHEEMIDLNDLRVFERVGALKSFSEASRKLDMPKSSLSRSHAAENQRPRRPADHRRLANSFAMEAPSAVIYLTCR